MWCPPPYLAGCSQLVLTHGNPTLVRNYDFHPRYFDGRMRFTEYCRPVIGIQDSGWGLLDGMNSDGLAAALAFGGRRATGTGFGVPLVIRYILETCGNVQEACAALARLPLHMSYSISLVDRAGHAATVFVNPDRPAEVVPAVSVTNHQHQVEWDDYAAFTRTLDRKEALEQCLADPGQSVKSVIRQFLKPPLYSQQYFRGFGTLYTAAYDVARGHVRVVWPEKQIEARFTRFEEQEADVVLLRPVGRYMVKGGSPRPPAGREDLI
jgi:predicted choloylglycine hydrolase